MAAMMTAKGAAMMEDGFSDLELVGQQLNQILMICHLVPH